jgi:hypothetical protein
MNLSYLKEPSGRLRSQPSGASPARIKPDPRLLNMIKK